MFPYFNTNLVKFSHSGAAERADVGTDAGNGVEQKNSSCKAGSFRCDQLALCQLSMQFRSTLHCCFSSYIGLALCSTASSWSTLRNLGVGKW